MMDIAQRLDVLSALTRSKATEAVGESFRAVLFGDAAMLHEAAEEIRRLRATISETQATQAEVNRKLDVVLARIDQLQPNQQ